MSARTLIIGDIHGMAADLSALWNSLSPTLEDRVILAGDVLDKGPDSVGAIKYLVKKRQEGFQITLVLGNHEEKHARFRTAFEKAGEKGIKKFKGKDEMRTITAGMNEEDIAFLDSAVPFFEMPEFNAVVVHGGILPEWETLDASNKGIVSRLLRTRHVTGEINASVTVEFSGLDFDPDFDPNDGLTPEQVQALFEAMAIVVKRKQVRPAGSFVSLGQEKDSDPFWAEVYDGRFGHVFFGHSPFISETGEPKRFPHATGLDTGAVFGGHLTAAVLEEGQEVRFVSVKASKKFATSLWDE